ncbi:MAG: L,D-transpeptidase [Hyphomicrobiaceae bacterium]
MTLSRAVATATFATGLIASGLILQALPASAQFYSDEGGFDRRYGSGRRGGFVMEPDYGYVNRGYRRYDRWRDRWSDPYDDRPRYRRWQDERGFDDLRDRQERANDEVRSGGPRPAIAAKAPPLAGLRTDYKPGTIIIDQSARKLYFIVSATTAYRYPISVGREGFSWTGSEKVSRIAEWPDWHPPEEMRERDPKLPVKMTGGINNPLGAKAIYLGKSLYRIHGTNDPKSIGRAASSGCFRMMNEHVLHLAGMVEIGAEVYVLKQLPKTVAAAQ